MPDLQPVAAPVVSNGARAKGPSRDALLAGLDAIPDNAGLDAIAKAPKLAIVEPEPAAEVEAAPVEKDEPEVEAADEPEVEPEAVEAKPDAETAKRLSVVQKAERRAKESIATERAEFAREREKHAASVRDLEAKQSKLDSLAKRARLDPTAVLSELGLTDEDFEAAAQHLYVRRKGAVADPKTRAAAEAASRDRESADTVAKLQARLDARDKADAEREQAASNAASRDAYLDRVTKTVTADQPLLKALHAKNPAKARAELLQVGIELYRSEGEEPDPADVAAAWEQRKRAEIEDLGLAPAKAAPVGAPPSKTLGSGGGKTVVKPKLSAKDRDAELRRKLESDDLT